MTWDIKWSAVSASAAVAGVLVPLLLFILSRDSKELSVETVSRSILVDFTDRRLSALKLTYKDVPVSRLTVVTIEVRNSGTRPIERTDFERPIVLRFQEPSDILAVTVDEKIHQNLEPTISSDVNSISIAPLLLNPGDRFRLTAQLRGDFNEPAVEARISGVSSISRVTFREWDLIRRGLMLIGSGLVGSMTYFYFASFTNFAHRSRRQTVLPRPEAIAVTLLLGFAHIISLLAGATLLNLVASTNFGFV